MPFTARPTTLLLASPAHTPSPGRLDGGCVPGRDGIPDSPLGHLTCGDYLTHAPRGLWVLAETAWPLLLTAAVLATAARVGWLMWRRHRWRAAAAQAVWLQIVPPVTATPAATHALWQLLATVLPAPRYWMVCPRRLVWEVHATPDGMRAGLWVPPAINPTAVVRALHRAWPGVRAQQTSPPVIAAGHPAAGTALRPTRPDWLPLVNDPTPPTTRRREHVEADTDQLRAVYDGLAAAGRTGGGLLQIHLTRAPRRRVAVLRRASLDPRRAHRRGSGRNSGRGPAWAAVLALQGLRAALAGVLDVVLPGPPGSRRVPTILDPVAAEQARQARAKYAAGPHLLVAVRATATGPTIAAARAAAADITAGFSLLSPHWRPHRLHRSATAARGRWVPETRMHLAAVAEAAALAGLPAEPPVHGMPAAPSRRLAPTRDVFTPTATTASTSRAGRPSPAPRHHQATASDAGQVDDGSAEEATP